MLRNSGFRWLSNGSQIRIVNFKKAKMKSAALFVVFICLSLIGCRKDTCNAVTITRSVRACSGWGIITRGNKVYPSESIPDIFKVEGEVVCATFELYEDASLCPSCCGGTKARILTMTYPPE